MPKEEVIMIDKLIEHFNLEKHPEGGYFCESYRSQDYMENESLPENIIGRRNYATAIYFLLGEGDCSKFHRIKSDETWHFYLGGPLVIAEIDEDGQLIETILGQDFISGQKMQYTVKANRWFASYPMANTEFSFVGCSVAPGFDFRDFEIAQSSQLLEEFGENVAQDLIERLSL